MGEPGAEGPAAAPQNPGRGHRGRDRQGRGDRNSTQQHQAPPSSLERRCVRQFPRIALGRGRQYFNAGRVADPVWTDKLCAVKITGTGGEYNISFDFTAIGPENNRLPATCDCPAYARGLLCKHLWAAILQVDKASPPGSIPDGGPLKLIHSQPAPPRERGGDRVGERGERQARGQFPKPVAHRPINGNGGAQRAPSTGYNSSWIDRLNQLQGLNSTPSGKLISTSAAAYFVISATETNSTGKLVLDLWTRNRSTNGDLGPLRPNRVSSQDFSQFDDLRDQEVLSLLSRSCNPQLFAPFGRSSSNISTRFTVDPIFESHLIPLLAGSGKLFLSRSPQGSPDSAERALRLDRGKPWELELRIEIANADFYRLDGILRRDGEMRSLQRPLAILRGGFILFEDRICRFSEPGHAPWAAALRGTPFMVPRTQGDALITRILMDPASPKVTWPPEMGWTHTKIEPRPKGVFRPLGNDPSTGRMTLTVSFDYDGREVALSESEMTLVDLVQKRVLSRNPEFEEKSLLQALDIMKDPSGTGSVGFSDLHRAANELCAAGWQIHFENQQLRIANDFVMNVSSNTDWFDLKMEADFGDLTVAQADLLAALESGSGLVKLSDGSLGMLPPDWLAKYAPVAQLGNRMGELNEDGTMRFNRSHGLMLNAALGDDSRVQGDTGFNSFREKIRQFQGVETAKAPAGFKGKLRDYQREGLTWLGFLEEFETGGILADDMGLGKTIQILAFLLARSKKQNMPSIVIAPKSLTFNWIDEAAKFAPSLKVIRFSGAGRSDKIKDLQEADLVVTTYGTLRTDIDRLREIEFDVAIIDEAQAIKNKQAQSSVAVKQIRARHRLALTGTPIENSLNDLLSILEFTNPGLLSVTQQKELAAGTQAVLNRMLKPFLLRRTKEKVLTELPDKSEQVLFCEMNTVERQFYNAIRDKYRASLEAKIEAGGIGKSKLHVLEALLRLRQASCHAGLIDPKLKGEPSAKLQLLLNHVQEVIQEGHKVLIFSQFTSLLALVRTMFDAENLKYEYLDGQTEDRKTPVERFQTDKSISAFLISLKAGGTGLNLTAADYVFILDPWWNPAVEAQAIGRAHRMGQNAKVFAYRMIAKGTVEEKILELQQTKKDLAESIISEDQDFLKKLTRDDLELLLT